MRTDADGLLAERFAALPDEPDLSDWHEVVRRAGRDRRKQQRLIALVAVTALIVVGAASAVFFGGSTVNFLHAAKGPQSAVVDFGSMQVGAPAGMAPGVLPHQTRRITSYSIDGKQHILYVAPTKAGGFCEEWTNFDGGCRATRVGGLGVTGSAAQRAESLVTTVINGEFFQSGGTRLVVSFADGTSAQIPFVWVTKPINAGFYIYRIPEAHREPGHQATKITLFNAHGRVITEAQIRTPRALLPRTITHHLRGFPPIHVPAQAIYSKRQQLFDIRVAKGHRIGLWISPERGGGTCIWGNRVYGCTLNGAPAARVARARARLKKEGKLKPLPATAIALLGLGGGNPPTICCHVGNNVARVELRFQNGTRIELTPRKHYLLAIIPANHYALGHRLDEMVAYNQAGNVIARKTINTKNPGVYPCTKPKNLGYGVTECP